MDSILLSHITFAFIFGTESHVAWVGLDLSVQPRIMTLNSQADPLPNAEITSVEHYARSPM